MVARLRMASILPAQRSRIAFRQAGMVVVIAFILGAIVSTVQIVLDYRDQGNQLTGNLDRLIQSVERPAANALWELNETLSAGLVNGLLGYGPIVSARLETLTGDELAVGTRAVPASTLETLTGWMFPHERTRTVPLLFRDGETLHRVGTLSMQINPAPMVDEFLSRAAVILVSGLVRSLAFALVLFAVFYFSLTRPLTALSHQLASTDPASPKPTTVQAAVERDDELGDLAKDVNILLHDIHTHIERQTQAQQDLQALNATLEQRVEQRTADLTNEINARIHIENRLRIAVEEAHHNADAKARLLANMSHELRTPLNAIIGFSEFTKQRLTAMYPEKVRENLDLIHESGSNLLTLVNAILDLSRIDAGQMPVTSETFDAGRLLREIAEQLRPVVARNGNALDIDTESVQVYSDPQKLGQILRNLIGNAAKFTHGGTVSVSLKRNPEDPDTLLIDVADTGIGIDRDTLSTIFHPFVQGDDGLSKRYEGSGLGLAIVRELCGLLDVRIDVESQPGQGSRFSLHVPAKTVPVAASA